jgi:DNA-directed RNA polymerase specialized sigma24 family protein
MALLFFPRLQLRCLQLFYCDGLSYAEIARNLKRDKGQITYQIRCAKRKISQFFPNNKGECT